MAGQLNVTYQDDMALLQTLWVKIWIAILFIMLALGPLVLSRYLLSILNEMAIAVIGALGLNLLVGFTGQISLCHGAFLAIGAYASALLTGNLGFSFWLALPLSGVVAALLGMVVGIPSLRLKGLYLALGTLAFGFIVEYVIFHWELTRGDMGMAVPRIGLGRFELVSELHFFYFLAVVAALGVLAAKNIARSKIGRSFVAIRDRDIAAEAMGIPIAKYKITAFAISAFFGGVAGSLVAHYQRWIVPGNFDFSLSIAFIAMIVIGGMGSVLGSVLGAILISGIPHLIVMLADLLKPQFPAISGLLVDIKLGIFGLIIVATLLFEPRGLVGIYNRTKLYWKTWPFKY